MSELDARLRDEIDDQVADALDAYLAERVLIRPQRAWVVVLTIALGAVVTLLAPVGVAVGCGIWFAIAVTNVVLLTSRRGS